MGPVINAATYMAPGLGEGKLALAVTAGRPSPKGRRNLPPPFGRYGAAAAEGGVASGLSSAVHQGGGDTFDIDKVIKDTAKGVALGVAGAKVDSVTSTAHPVVQQSRRLCEQSGPGAAAEQWDCGRAPRRVT